MVKYLKTKPQRILTIIFSPRKKCNVLSENILMTETEDWENKPRKIFEVSKLKFKSVSFYLNYLVLKKSITEKYSSYFFTQNSSSCKSFKELCNKRLEFFLY